jgi:hypothetical protein
VGYASAVHLAVCRLRGVPDLSGGLRRRRERRCRGILALRGGEWRPTTVVRLLSRLETARLWGCEAVTNGVRLKRAESHPRT